MEDTHANLFNNTTVGFSCHLSCLFQSKRRKLEGFSLLLFHSLSFTSTNPHQPYLNLHRSVQDIIQYPSAHRKILAVYLPSTSSSTPPLLSTIAPIHHCHQSQTHKTRTHRTHEIHIPHVSCALFPPSDYFILTCPICITTKNKNKI